jgi:chromate transporter
MPQALPDEGDDTAPALRAPRSPMELFLTFSGLSLQSFGGAIALIERAVVRRKRWLSAEEFIGLFGISQVLPGPSGVSFCVLLGDRFFGVRGAIAAVSGFLLPPAVVMLVIASLFQQFHHLPQVQGALHGMAAAATGFIGATLVRMCRTLRGDYVGTVVAVLTFSGVALAHIPVGWIVLSLGALSVLWAWRRLGQ